MVIVRQSAKSETLDISFNKATHNKSGVDFSDIASYMPVNLTDDITGLKAFIDFDDKMDESGAFTLDLDGEPLENNMFLDPSFSLDDKE